MSNKYAGPLHRMRLAIKQLANAEPVSPLKLRKGDLLQEMAEDLNRIAARIQSSDAKIAAGNKNHEAVVAMLPEMSHESAG